MTTDQSDRFERIDSFIIGGNRKLLTGDYIKHNGIGNDDLALRNVEALFAVYGNIDNRILFNCSVVFLRFGNRTFSDFQGGSAVFV